MARQREGLAARLHVGTEGRSRRLTDQNGCVSRGRRAFGGKFCIRWIEELGTTLAIKILVIQPVSRLMGLTPGWSQLSYSLCPLFEELE
jgi:hypothetical protein